MAFKFGVLCAFLAVANAGYPGAPAYTQAVYTYGGPHTVATPAVISQQANILRSYGNLGQVSSFSKSINTPHSSVYKSDVRVNNNALSYPYGHGYVAAPAFSHAYAAPVYAQSYVSPTYAHTYSGPAVSHGYATPAYAQHYATAPAGLLGVAYSSAPAAAHFTYNNGYGVHYSY